MVPAPSELRAATVRAVRRMLREHITGSAAELAYYGLLSTVPCIAAFVGILGLLGSDPETTEAIARIVREGASTEAGETAQDAARHVLDRDGAAGVALGAGVVTTLWVASVYLAAFRRAAYRVHGADPGPAWRVRPLQMGLTFLGLVVLAVVAIVLAVTKRLVREIGQVVGAEDTTVAIWSLARWPLVFSLAVLVTAGLYSLAPRKARPRAWAPSVGSVAAVLVWLLSSVGFEVWVGNFADYDATYGALAGAVAFAVWLWISNLALLFGIVLDLELSRPRRAALPSAPLGPRREGRHETVNQQLLGRALGAHRPRPDLRQAPRGPARDEDGADHPTLPPWYQPNRSRQSAARSEMGPLRLSGRGSRPGRGPRAHPPCGQTGR
jgi:membrane protein